MKLVAGVAVAASLAQGSQIASDGVNPVSHVVTFLKGIQTTAEKEYKKEQKLYLRFKCWAEHTVKTKEASNKVAEKRAKSLGEYIQDIEAGKIEFTSERVDLEKELKDLKKTIADAEALRSTEKADFSDAKNEMQDTIAALKEAISILEDATKGHEEGVLVQVSRVGAKNSEGFTSRAEEGARLERVSLERVSQLAPKVLSKGDALFLQRLLSGEVPKADWKKLNRKATFKMSYKARSFKILEVLRKLSETVQSSLGAANDKETEAAANFEKLMTAKEAEKLATETALEKLEKEHGARNMSKGEAQDEIDALTQQINDDTKLADEAGKALEDKTNEWKTRETLRLGEIDAIAKAIEILSNDDARDVMTRSFKSQGYSFLQSVSEISDLRQKEASKQLDRLGASRFKALASMVMGSQGHFDAVIKAIDGMVSTMKQQEEADLKQKDACEKNREEHTRNAALESREMDELTDGIQQLNVEIARIDDEIKTAEGDMKAAQEQLDSATQQREAEHKEWLASDADDAEAKLTVEKAKGVLETYYTENGLMLAQGVRSEPVVEKPKTWEGDYAGRTDESGSIIAILEMIVGDISKDIKDAKASEDKSQAAFDEFKSESETRIDDLKLQISNLNDTKAEKNQGIAENKDAKASKGEILEAVMKTIAAERPGCDFLAVNYPMRVKNRKIEMDGLIKAKAILQGGEFNVDTDGTRELKPGDAFLQK